MKRHDPEDRYFAGQVLFNHNKSSTTFGGATLAEAVADAFKVASYHMAYHDDVRISQILDICKCCEGDGKVPTGKLYQYKRCPRCKGKDSSIVACDSFVPVISSNVEIVQRFHNMKIT